MRTPQMQMNQWAVSCAWLQVQVAVVQSLAAHVGQADPRPAEYLLQKVLLLLAAMHKRSACGKTPVQLRELAEAAFDALRARQRL